jgi:hypothetical protein
MDHERPSFARRAIAAIVLVVVAVLLLRVVIGALSAIFWLVAVVVLIVAALWAVATLKAGRGERRVKPSHAPQVTAHEDRVSSQMDQIREELRKQGRI